MHDSSSSESTELPKEAPHFFTEVAFDLLPEVNYDDIVYLSEIVRLRSRVQDYSGLRDALRKIQWAKLAGIEAIEIEKEIARGIKPNSVPFYPIGQAQHAKALLECVSHAKAALDSIAVFLTDLLCVQASGGQRDFRHQSFRHKVTEKDALVGASLKSVEKWLDDLVKRRDLWIHRSSPSITLTLPATSLGLLPVPKELAERPSSRHPIDKGHYWSTEEFVELQVTKVAWFFGEVVKRSIDAELRSIPQSSLPPRKAASKDKVSFFRMQTTIDMTINGINYRV